MIVYYENSNGEKINLLQSPYRVIEADWYDSDWEEKTDGYEKEVELDVFGSKVDFVSNMERLYKVFAVDSELGVCGKLYVNGSYIRCNVLQSKKDDWKGYVFATVELVFIAPKLEWIQEVKKSFYPHAKENVAIGLNYPFNYPYNYTAENRDVVNFEIDHITANDFRMIVYGPCVNPCVFINGCPYEVYASLDKYEYLVIDSEEYTITKYQSNGTTANLFDNRGHEYSVFEKIPSGYVNFNWSGDFGFDLLLYLKRKEAKW